MKYLIGIILLFSAISVGAVEVPKTWNKPVVDQNGNTIPDGMLWGYTVAWRIMNPASSDCLFNLGALTVDTDYDEQRKIAEDVCYNLSPNNAGSFVDIPDPDVLSHTNDADAGTLRMYRISAQYWKDDRTGKNMNGRQWSPIVTYAPILELFYTQPETLRLQIGTP